MTSIEEMPCGGRIAIDTPGYNPCDDCQGVRLLCGAEQCQKADTPAAAPVRAPAEPQGDRFAEFEAWMIANGAGEKYARDTLKGARRCIQAGVTSSAAVNSETLPGLARSSLAIYRNALKKFEGFLAETARPTPQAAAVVPETVAAMPEVEEAHEPATAPQERAERVLFIDEATIADELERVADEAPGEISDERALLEMMGVLALSMNRLARMLELEHARLGEALVELRRPKVYRLRLGGEALVYEEAPTL